MLYTGKPLITSGGAVQKDEGVREMMIWDNLIKAGQAAGGDQGGKLIQQVAVLG